MDQESILIVDDEEAICRLCCVALNDLGFSVNWTTNPVQALEMLEEQEANLLITDVKMPGYTGIELMHRAHELHPALAVIVMTAYATVDTAFQAVREGASDFIPKPFHLDELKFAVLSVLEKQRLVNENIRLKSMVNLMQVSEQIATVHDPAELYPLVLKAVIEETGATHGKIYHVDNDTHDVVHEYASGIATEANIDAARALQEIPEANWESAFKETFNDMQSAVSIPLRSKNKFKGMLSLYNEHGMVFSKSDLDVVSILASQTAVALENSELLQEREKLFLETIKSLASTIDEKDPYTAGHSERVSAIAEEMASAWDLMHRRCKSSLLPAPCMILAKSAFPTASCKSPAASQMKSLPSSKPIRKGSKDLRPIQRLGEVTEAVYAHHEWYNGRGYPRRLKGNEIPMAGAIVNVADALDTIVSDRPYHKRRTPEEAYQIVKKDMGTQFNPDVAYAILDFGPLTQIDKYIASLEKKEGPSR